MWLLCELLFKFHMLFIIITKFNEEYLPCLHFWPDTNFSEHQKHSPLALLASISLLERVLADRLPILCGVTLVMCCIAVIAAVGVGNRGIPAVLVGGSM